jgi:type IV pilus assembly protein PilP
MRALTTLVVLSLMMLSAPVRGAQTPTPSPTPAPAPNAASPAQPTPAPKPQADQYSYNPDGRRDPFLNLLNAGIEPRSTGGRKGDGPGGLSVSEISVNGVLHGRTGLVAMIQGPDKKTYVVHQGDKFADGTIKNIIPQGLIIVQEVNDPLSLVKQREIRKLLRSLEDAKE